MTTATYYRRTGETNQHWEAGKIYRNLKPGTGRLQFLSEKGQRIVGVDRYFTPVDEDDEDTLELTYDQLDDSAKDTARAWYCSRFDGDDYAFVIEDAKEAGALFGLDVENIWWRGFGSQGDGAVIVGTYSFKSGGLAAVQAHAPQDTELHCIVEALQGLSVACQLAATEDDDDQELYIKAYGRDAGCPQQVTCDAPDWFWDNDKEDEARQLLQDYADWVYQRLDAENDWLTSDENCAEACEANGYLFTVAGEYAWAPSKA